MDFSGIDRLLQTDNYDIAKKMLDGLDVEFRGIASNIANSETPGYKSVTISKSFQTQLEEAASTGDTTSLSNISPYLETDLDVTTVKENGNNVEIDRQLVALNDVSLQQQFVNTYLTHSLKQVTSAITGSAQ